MKTRKVPGTFPRTKSTWYLFIIFIIAVCFVISLPVQAAVPWMINYQGRLTDAEGKSIRGTYTFTFRLYDASTGGTKQWQEEQTITLTEADNGIFNVVLGAVTTLSSTDFNSPMWLSVQVADDAEMTPRQRLTATGYALNADQLDSLDSSKFLRADIDSSASGKLTITKAGAAFLIKPSTDPDANTKMIDVQSAAGTSEFSVDSEGDVTVAGDLTVSGTIAGTTSATGTTNTSWTIGSATSAASNDISILFGQSSGQESLVFDGDSSDDFVLSDDLRLSTQATLRLEDDSGGDYVALKAPTGVTTYTLSLPAAVATAANQVLASDTSGNLSWTTASGISGVGDVTDVGNCTGSACFTGSAGTTLTSTTSDAINLATDATFIFARNDSGDVTFQGKDDDSTAHTIYDTAGAGTITVGSSDVTSITLTTDGTGTGEVVLPNDSIGAAELADFGTLTATAGRILVADGTDFESVAMSGDVTIDSTGATTVADGSHSHTGSTITHSLDDAYDDGASITVDAANVNMTLSGGYDVVLDDMSSSQVFTLQNAQTTPDPTQLYVADAASGGISIGDFVVAVQGAADGVVIDTQGAANLDETGASPALTNVSDARESLAIASRPDLSDSDGVIKLGRNGGNWEYIWYNDSATNGEFVFSATTRVESSSPAYLLFSPPASSGGSPGNRYGVKFDPDVTPKTLSFVEITNPGASQIENVLFEMKAGGRMGLEFTNLVRNGSFEAFSALETFVGSTATGGTGGSGSNYQGGWPNFAPDEWLWVAGKVFQHAPVLFTPSTTVTATNLQQDFFHGKSAVSIQDGDTSLAYSSTDDSTITSTITRDGAIKQVLKGLKPSTTYAIGVKARVTAANTAAKVNITGEDTSGQLTPINQSTAAELSTNSTSSFTDLVGTFKTSDTAGDITVYLICQQTGTPGSTDVCRFDAVQVVASKSVPEFAPNSLVDTGDQTVYGSLRMGRTADDRGGILSVDKALRTRAIEFFEKDPGISGQAGGFGNVAPPTKSVSSTASTMSTTGTYTGVEPIDIKVTIEAGATTFKWSQSTCSPTGCTAFSTPVTGQTVATSSGSATAIGTTGIKVYFSSSPAVAATEEWVIHAAGANLAGQYSSFSGTATYTAGQTRIFKDPTRGLMFQDGTISVSLADITGSGISQPAWNSPRTFIPASGGGGTLDLQPNGTNTLTAGAASVEYWVEIQTDGTGGAADQFRWSTNQGTSWTGPTTIDGTAQALSNGVTVMFSPSPYNAGNVGDRWTFTAYPPTSSTAIKTLTGNQGISVTGTGDTRTVAVKDCAANEVLKRNAGDTDWVCASDATGTDSQNLFQTIAVPDANNAVADSATDTLTLAAGSGVTISGDASTDTITISATGSGGDVTDVGDCTGSACFTTAASGNSGNTLAFEGATADAVENLLTSDDPTVADATFKLPNLGAGNTVYLTSDATAVTSLAGVGLAIASNTLALAPSEVGAVTWLDNADRAWTFDIAAAGTNPVLSFSSNTINVSTGTLQVGGAAVLTSESDPQVGTLTSTKWCTTDGSAVNCATNAPVTAETDPVVAAINGLVKSNGTTIAAAVANTDYEPALTDSASLAATLSDETGTGLAVFATSPTITTPTVSGNITYSGTQPKRTIVLTAAGAIVASSSGSADQRRVDGTNFKYYVLDYDQSTDEKAYWQFVVPDSFTASTLTITLFWTSTGGTAGQLVDWEVSTNAVANDDVFDADLDGVNADVTINDALIATGDLHETPAGSIVTGDNGWAPGELAIVMVNRDADDATNDTLAADARLVMVKLEWTASAESD